MNQSRYECIQCFSFWDGTLKSDFGEHCSFFDFFLQWKPFGVSWFLVRNFCKTWLDLLSHDHLPPDLSFLHLKLKDSEARYVYHCFLNGHVVGGTLTAPVPRVFFKNDLETGLRQNLRRWWNAYEIWKDPTLLETLFFFIERYAGVMYSWTRWSMSLVTQRIWVGWSVPSSKAIYHLGGILPFDCHFCPQSALDHLATEIDDLSDDLHSYPSILQHNLGSEWPVKFTN